MRKLKDENGKRAYVAPAIEILSISFGHTILAGSPGVTVGPSVEPPVEDDTDTDLSGAKKFNMWSEWEDWHFPSGISGTLRI